MLERFAMRLLLLPLIIAGINGDSEPFSLTFTFPCAHSACYHIWRFTPKTESVVDVVIASNGEMLKSPGDDYQDQKCTKKLPRLTEDNIGTHYCRIMDDAFTPQNEAPVFKEPPGFGVSFQCTLLSFLTLGHCLKRQRSDVRLTWLDQDNREVGNNLRYRISRMSTCDVTLTVNLQAPGSEAFRCQATMGKNTWTSAEMRVQVPVAKGKGRRDSNFKEVEPQGDSRYEVTVVVAVLACATLTALAAMFVVIRRRKAASNLPGASCSTAIHNHVADDVVYADVVLPDGAQSVFFSQGQDTEYACIRHQ
ncbi:diverse immunoglobulin domain-containing protein 3.1 [Vanacampus margaritifer]